MAAQACSSRLGTWLKFKMWAGGTGDLHRPGPYTALQDTANALQGHTLSQDICKDSDVAKDREAAEALDSF